ncbi:MAG: rRNA maturation RNase YbeY [Ruminococcaceae bacterium]|nr:rRNA maturation RNase YbeY [Oscillospiraceae bacterium]
MKNLIYTRDKTSDKSFTPALRALVKRAVNETLSYEQVPHMSEVSVTFVDEEEIKRLNCEFRNRDDVTDVLSFPTLDEDSEIVPFDNEAVTIGDVIICKKRCMEQAETFGHSLEREVAYLTIHSTLHLLGYDHMVENEEKEMTEKQDIIIEKVRLI